MSFKQFLRAERNFLAWIYSLFEPLNNFCKRSPVEKVDKLQNLVSRPDVILGNPDELISLSWEQEVNLDLP